jgi:glycosyltransferase involved in cell wall biosynthesis
MSQPYIKNTDDLSDRKGPRSRVEEKPRECYDCSSTEADAGALPTFRQNQGRAQSGYNLDILWAQKETLDSVCVLRHMINGKHIAVVMPAYNAEKTLEVTVGELPDLVDIRILVDDRSRDHTVDLARNLGLLVFRHDRNYGYGRNQMTCYREALAAGADVVIMLHPDYQYTPLLVTAMASMVAYDVYDVVLGSRIIGGRALLGGMPLYKYISNRLLTAFENLFLRVKLSEYHTGYRAFSRRVLTELPLLENSDDFVFDNQMLAQCVHFGFRIGEVSCPTKYFEEASSINFRRSVEYGFGVLATTLQFAAQRLGIVNLPRFSQQGRKLAARRDSYYATPSGAA